MKINREDNYNAFISIILSFLLGYQIEVLKKVIIEKIVWIFWALDIIFKNF